jgi:hypothetical protein
MRSLASTRRSPSAERRAANDLVPGPDAGKGSIHDDPFRDAIRILRRERVANHVADVVGDEIGLLDGEAVEHAGNVAG